ncbi:MAG: hypothetical protein EOO45_07205 [Flavobacterium sp.]|nr:MAG: hypothetical protein EOO45_07205 [Flavobacterium sp.]
MEHEIINITDQADWIKKTIEIKASDDNVWTVITNPDHIGNWANSFEAGTNVSSDFTENSSVIWKDGKGQAVMNGKVEVSYPAKMLKVGFFDALDSDVNGALGAYKEHYLLSESEGKTTLTIESGPMEQEYLEKVGPQWDEALRTIKSLSEAL